MISAAVFAPSPDVTQQEFFQSHTIGYLKIHVQERTLLLAEHDILGNLQQETETLSHIKMSSSYFFNQMFSSDIPLGHVRLLLILRDVFT